MRKSNKIFGWYLIHSIALTTYAQIFCIVFLPVTIIYWRSQKKEMFWKFGFTLEMNMMSETLNTQIKYFHKRSGNNREENDLCIFMNCDSDSDGAGDDDIA